MRERVQPRIPWGLIAGASAWAISTQVNYMLATAHCEGSAWPRAMTSLLSFALCVWGIVQSWLAWTSGPDATSVSHSQRPRQLIAGVSVLAGAMFGLAILAQALAQLFFGCRP
jgi:hypothetical protein